MIAVDGIRYDFPSFGGQNYCQENQMKFLDKLKIEQGREVSELFLLYCHKKSIEFYQNRIIIYGS